MSKYHEGIQVFSEIGTHITPEDPPEGVTVIEVDPHSFQFSKMKH